VGQLWKKAAHVSPERGGVSSGKGGKRKSALAWMRLRSDVSRGFAPEKRGRRELCLKKELRSDLMIIAAGRKGEKRGGSQQEKKKKRVWIRQGGDQPLELRIAQAIVGNRGAQSHVWDVEEDLGLTTTFEVPRGEEMTLHAAFLGGVLGGGGFSCLQRGDREWGESSGRRLALAFDFGGGAERRWQGERRGFDIPFLEEEEENKRGGKRRKMTATVARLDRRSLKEERERKKSRPHEFCA